MKRVIELLIVWYVCTAAAQADDQVLAAINEEIWRPFTQSYLDTDGPTYTSLFHPETVRVSLGSGRVNSGQGYINRVLANFTRRKDQGHKGDDIQFRFLKRFHNADSAYETGVFQIGPVGSDRRNYGSFSVVLKKHAGRWKILFDSDQAADQAAWDAAPIRLEGDDG